jgi:GNAT superfamily N-acetyltransferase
VEIRRARYDDPAARELTTALAEELLARYEGRPGSDGEPDAADFGPPGGAFLLAVEDDGAVGCGGVCRYDRRMAELRRMYVVPESRGRGLSRALLAALEQEARGLGYGAVRLETGHLQPEAIALYTSAGYTPVEPFGVYRDAPGCRCFAKHLSSNGPRLPRLPEHAALNNLCDTLRSWNHPRGPRTSVPGPSGR